MNLKGLLGFGFLQQRLAVAGAPGARAGGRAGGGPSRASSFVTAAGVLLQPQLLPQLLGILPIHPLRDGHACSERERPQAQPSRCPAPGPQRPGGGAMSAPDERWSIPRHHRGRYRCGDRPGPPTRSDPLGPSRVLCTACQRCPDRTSGDPGCAGSLWGLSFSSVAHQQQPCSEGLLRWDRRRSVDRSGVSAVRLETDHPAMATRGVLIPHACRQRGRQPWSWCRARAPLISGWCPARPSAGGIQQGLPQALSAAR
jgi:hypothetical protein